MATIEIFPSDAAYSLPLGLRAALGLLLGAIVGSFLGAVAMRWPQGRAVSAGRSRCDACDAKLGPGELVPILSYFMRRGRCAHCGAAIDARHVAMEIGAAAIGLASFAAFDGAMGPATALLGWWLLLIATLDLDHHWLPDRLTLPLIAAGLVAAWAGIGVPLADRTIGAAAGLVILWGIGALYRRARAREGLGGGDPKLLAAIGAWLGWQQLPFVLLGAGLVGLALLTARRLRGIPVAATDRLPLGTLMAIAAWPLWIVAGS